MEKKLIRVRPKDATNLKGIWYQTGEEIKAGPVFFRDTIQVPVEFEYIGKNYPDVHVVDVMIGVSGKCWMWEDAELGDEENPYSKAIEHVFDFLAAKIC